AVSALRGGVCARLLGLGVSRVVSEARLEQPRRLGRVLDRELPGPAAPVRARDRGALDEADLEKLLKLAMDLAALQAAHRGKPRRDRKSVVEGKSEDQGGRRGLAHTTP